MSHGMRSPLLSALATMAIACGLASRISADDQIPPADKAAPDKAAAADKEGTAEQDGPVKYLLALKFQPQQIIRYEIMQESEITTQLSGETETAKNSTQMKRHYKVTAVDKKTGAGDLELSIDWVRMVASFENGNSDPEPLEFQSDDPEKHPDKYKHVLETVGRPRAAIRFGTQGKPLKVLWGAPAAVAGAPDAQPAPAIPQKPGAGVETSHETYFLPLPEEPIAIGQSWKELFHILARNSEKNLVRVTIQRSYTLTGVENGRATVDFRTTVLTPVQDPSVLGQLIQREISGKMVLDLERGLVMSRESAVENTVINPFGQKSQMHAKSSYRERLLEDAAAGAPAVAPDQGAIGETAKK